VKRRFAHHAIFRGTCRTAGKRQPLRGVTSHGVSTSSSGFILTLLAAEYLFECRKVWAGPLRWAGFQLRGEAVDAATDLFFGNVGEETLGQIDPRASGGGPRLRRARGASAEARAAAAAGMMLHQDGSRQQDTAHDDGYKSIPKKRKRRKTPGPCGVNTCLCDDDANSPTRDSGERGEKHRSRYPIWRQSQDKWKVRDLTSDERMGPRIPAQAFSHMRISVSR
jgi:hypothetical protein